MLMTKSQKALNILSINLNQFYIIILLAQTKFSDLNFLIL